MYRTREQITKEIEKLMKELNRIALLDNEITGEEFAIIHKIEEEMKNMKSQLFQILESELDNAEFNDLMMDCLHDTIHNVEQVALSDDIITEDEYRLLKVLKDFVSRGGKVQ